MPCRSFLCSKLWTHDHLGYCVGFRGAMLNLKDCRYPTSILRDIARLIYPTPCSPTISGVLVLCICLAGKILIVQLHDLGIVLWVVCPFVQFSLCIHRRFSFSVSFLCCAALCGWCCMVFCFVGVTLCLDCCWCVMVKTWSGRYDQGNSFEFIYATRPRRVWRLGCLMEEQVS